MKKAVIGAGSNLGDREKNLLHAISALKNLPLTNVIKCSCFYNTAPFGVDNDQGDYLNACVYLETEFSPHALLGILLGIEASMGRTREDGVVGSRPIDLDLLIYEGFKSDSRELTVPHPRMCERAFVLIPLCELFPNKTALNWDFSDAFEKADKNGIQKIF